MTNPPIWPDEVGSFDFKIRRAKLPRTAHLPNNAAVFAIGDIHGHLDLLNALLLFADYKIWPARGIWIQKYLISMGDVFDRGPHGIACLDRLRAGSLHSDVSTTILWGNHDILLDAVATGSDESEVLETLADRWMQWGGDSVVEELGIGQLKEGSVLRFKAKLAAAIGRERIAYLRTFQDHLRLGQFLFVHAGIDPSRTVEESLADSRGAFLAQYDRHWAFIRSGFLDQPHNFDGLVVHGHTPALEPVINKYRIGIDTGAYYTGRLTGVLIETSRAKTSVQFVTVSRRAIDHALVSEEDS